MDRIYPDGATDIVVSAGTVAVHGPAQSFRLMSGCAEMVGFRIRGGAPRTVLGVSPAELGPAPVSLGTLWGRRGREFEACVADIGAPAARAAATAAFLAGQVPDAGHLDAAVLEAVCRIDRAPDGLVRSAAHDAGLSELQMRRRFRDHVELGIKQYARITRFQRLLDAARLHKRRFGATPPGWAALAFEQGFADQAHLIREVRAFTGLTPAALLLTI